MTCSKRGRVQGVYGWKRQGVTVRLRVPLGMLGLSRISASRPRIRTRIVIRDGRRLRG